MVEFQAGCLELNIRLAHFTMRMVQIRLLYPECFIIGLWIRLSYSTISLNQGTVIGTSKQIAQSEHQQLPHTY